MGSGIRRVSHIATMIATMIATLTCATAAGVIAAAQAPAAGRAAAGRTPATLAQLMEGILFPSSNVIFAAQGADPSQVKAADDPSTATDPLASSYGGWQAVENAGLALTEAANLLTVPGRRCSNGRLAPVQNADWIRFVQGLRAAGVTAYSAAQSKNQDRILEAADAVTTACSNCHDKYREKPKGPADRCL